MGDTKITPYILKGGTATPFLSIYSSKGTPIMDPKNKLPIGTYVSDFWYEYREEDSDECEITIECDNPDLITLPELSVQSTLILQWGYIYFDNTSYNGPVRKVMIRDYQADFNETGTRFVLKCTDLVAILKNKPADYTNKLFGVWLENNITGKFAISIIDFEVKKGLVTETPWNKATYGNGKKARVEIQKPSVTPSSEFEGEEIFKPGDSTTVNQKLLNDRDKYYVGNEKIVNQRVLYGSDRTLYSQLKSYSKLLEGNYAVDTRDDKVEIHTPNFNQKPIVSYTYAGGNGELLSVSIKTEKKTKKTNIAKSSSINPKTKEVSTNIHQSFVDVDNIPMYLKRPEDTVEKTMNAGRGTFNGWNGYNNSGIKSKTDKVKSAKDYESTQKDINQNYQLTPDDIREAIQYFYEDFNNKKTNYQSNPNAQTLLELIKGNSLGKYLVPVIRPVIYEIDPYMYGKTGDLKKSIVGEDIPYVEGDNQNNQVETTGYTFSNNGGYNSLHASGNRNLRKDPSVIIIGDSPRGRTFSKAEDFGSIRYSFKKVVIDTKMYVEADGARIMASATPDMLQRVMNRNFVDGNSQKQVVANIKVIGRPEIESSRVIQIENISSVYSGLWYTKKVRHQFNSSGYMVTAELIPKNLPKLYSSTTARVSANQGLSNWKNIKNAAKRALENGYTPQQALSDYEYSIQEKAALDEEFATQSQYIQIDSEDLSKNKSNAKVVVKSTSDSVNINEQRANEREKLKR